MKTVTIVSLGDTRSWMKSWIDRINIHLPVKIHFLSATEFSSHVPVKYDRMIFIGKSIFFSRENLARICASIGVDPLRVYTYPEEHLPLSSDEAGIDHWNTFIQQVIESPDPETPVEVIHFQPIKKVAILGKNIEESILETFHKHGLETLVPNHPFTIQRQGIHYQVVTESEIDTVGMVATIAEFQPLFSYSIPAEVDETRKTVFLKEFQTKAPLRNFRKQTVVFLVPDSFIPTETWSILFDLSRFLVERDQAQVLILCREVVVAGDTLEEKYRSTRKSGVLIEKIDFSKLQLRPTLDMRGSWIDFITERDSLSQRLAADWIVKVPGKKSIPIDLSPVMKSDRLITTMIRPENINLPPFALQCEGWFELPDHFLSTETLYAIQEIVDYCQQGIWSEKGRAVVDEEKCVLCLTCLRTCPWSAIDIDGTLKRKKARINWEQCHLCGLCASSCPAGAITLMGFEYRERTFCPTGKIPLHES